MLASNPPSLSRRTPGRFLFRPAVEPVDISAVTPFGLHLQPQPSRSRPRLYHHHFHPHFSAAHDRRSRLHQKGSTWPSQHQHTRSSRDVSSSSNPFTCGWSSRTGAPPQGGPRSPTVIEFGFAWRSVCLVSVFLAICHSTGFVSSIIISGIWRAMSLHQSYTSRFCCLGC
jgi:hypothetical protein